MDETTIKGEGIGSDKHSAIHQKDDLKFGEGNAEGVESKDLFRPLEGATSNAEENNDASSKEGAVMQNQKLRQTKAFLKKMMLVRREVRTCTRSRARAIALQRFTSPLPLIATRW